MIALRLPLGILAATGALVAIGAAKFEIGAYRLPQPYCTSDAHVREIREAKVDFIIDTFKCDPAVYETFARNGVGVYDSSLTPSWFGGQTNINGRLAEIWPAEAYAREVRRTRRDHAAVWRVPIFDEPSSLDFDQFARLLPVVARELPGRPAFGNLEPSTTVDTRLYLGVTNYLDYIAAFSSKVPMDHISFDLYPYAYPHAADWLLSRFYENFRVAGDAARDSGRELYYVPQVNSLKPHIEITENKLRYQANAALAFGAEKLLWACWGCGWWTNNVLTFAGTRTRQYARLATVNAELKAFAKDYMRYRRTETHFTGFTGAAEKWIEGSKKIFMPKVNFNEPDGVDTGFFTGVKATDNAALVVAEIVSRTQPDARGLLVFAAEDPFDTTPKTRTVVFRSPLANLKALCAKGPVNLTRDTDGTFSFSIASSDIVLVEGRDAQPGVLRVEPLGANESRETYAARLRAMLKRSAANEVALAANRAVGARPFVTSCRVLADACRNSGRVFSVSFTGEAAPAALSAAFACGARLDSATCRALGALPAARARFRRVSTEVASAGISLGFFTDVRASDGSPVLASGFAPQGEGVGERALLVFMKPIGPSRELTFRSQLPNVRAIGIDGPLALQRKAEDEYVLTQKDVRLALIVADDFK